MQMCYLSQLARLLGADGQADLKYVLSVAKSIGENLSKPLIVVDKSTVPVGTGAKVHEVIEAELKREI